MHLETRHTRSRSKPTLATYPNPMDRSIRDRPTHQRRANSPASTRNRLALVHSAGATLKRAQEPLSTCSFGTPFESRRSIQLLVWLFPVEPAPATSSISFFSAVAPAYSISRCCAQPPRAIPDAILEPFHFLYLFRRRERRTSKSFGDGRRLALAIQP